MAPSHLSGAATGVPTVLTPSSSLSPYHVLPQRLTFSDLQLFKTLTRIPTLLPSKIIIITDNTSSHFTIDDSLITQPDIPVRMYKSNEPSHVLISSPAAGCCCSFWTVADKQTTATVASRFTIAKGHRNSPEVADTRAASPESVGVLPPSPSFLPLSSFRMMGLYVFRWRCVIIGSKMINISLKYGKGV
ncbi:hypothetical protein SSX86_021282 [Deinandra increscens subsp. villosa]|uniref:Uncharacterized protein n=1 Tax=Deinandra increscens subsp. villosa TaxID=3103831 RepID=A0AAP0CR08_9ASTR